MEMDYRSLADLDKSFVWHPFTQMSEWAEHDPIIIEEGLGCFIKDTQGRWYLDGVSSLWVNIFGHRKKEIDDAVKGQLDKIAHSTLLGLGGKPSILLAARLVALLGQTLKAETRQPLTRVFYSDNGSTAVEVALKMAFQYWLQKGVTGRNAFLSLNMAYHGDTLGAVAVGGVDIFHGTFKPLLFTTYKSPAPYCYRCALGLEKDSCKMACLMEMEKILQEHSGEIAAVIIEPKMQAAGGMIAAPEGFLSGVARLCTKYGVLLIADEIATGFGRTGQMFACCAEGVVPDIICLSKGLTGGYMPLAVTVATDEIYNAFLGEFSQMRQFFHGHSYTGNALGCAAALAVIDLFDKEDVLNRLRPKIEILNNWLKKLLRLSHVGDVRAAGFMAGIELVKNKETRQAYPTEDKMGWRVALDVRDKGVFLRPLGNCIVIMPPLSISEDNLRAMIGRTEQSIIKVTDPRPLTS
ncbi:MAG: adenosylmethionine--8-amino-7-oxononanoate transaminase [Candidatus Magnetominusculus sp. LBB02]|nr:adenosylmethionine--8-amino-7-oxononanoate transaminase [Candidatus Magnetominusculus sp. LBB02]